MICFQLWQEGPAHSQSKVKVKFLPVQICMSATIIFILEHGFKVIYCFHSLKASLEETIKL